jgi:hypothetical protein
MARILIFSQEIRLLDGSPWQNGPRAVMTYKQALNLLVEAETLHTSRSH